MAGQGLSDLRNERAPEDHGGLSKSGWLVAIAQFAQEKVAEEHLRQQDFACYLPKFRERKIVRGARRLVESYLFGRYFFVRIADRWRSILGTRGVAEVLLSASDLPFIVPESAVAEIRSRERNGFVHVERRWFRRGQQVLIRRGLFEGRLGTFDGGTPEQREFALIDYLGAVRRVELSAGNLVAV